MLRTLYSGVLLPLSLMFLLLVPATSSAECSRPIRVPVAPSGFNVQVSDGRVGGVYPDLLRQLGAASGCQFEFPVVPRARLVKMFFDDLDADLFLPASRTSERDQKSLFVPLLKLTPALITLSGTAGRVADVNELLGGSKWRGAMVRSYTWGNEYEALVRQLEASKRLDYANDLRTVGLMLRSGRVEFTILPPTLLYSALQEGGDGQALPTEFRYHVLPGLPRSEVGVYISRRALSEADQRTLREGLQRIKHDGSLLRALQHYYPPDVLRNDVVLTPP